MATRQVSATADPQRTSAAMPAAAVPHKEVLGHFKMLLEEYSDEVMKPNRRPGRQKTLRDEGNIGLRPTLVRESDDLNTQKLSRICPLPQRTKRRGLVDDVLQ